jgi:hypothetical protein
MGIMQWFRSEDARLDDADASAAAAFDTAVAFCFTPADEGIAPHHTRRPKDPMDLADLCAHTIKRHAPAQQKAVAR